jgi:hypothetical protein
MVSDGSTNDLAATVATKLEQLDLVKYWDLVRRSLTEIFGNSEYEASASIDQIKARIELLTEENALLLYHSNPLQIAANLAGASSRPLTEKEKLKYEAIINEHRDDRPDENEITKAYPDDLRFH